MTTEDYNNLLLSLSNISVLGPSNSVLNRAYQLLGLVKEYSGGISISLNSDRSIHFNYIFNSIYCELDIYEDKVEVFSDLSDRILIDEVVHDTVGIDTIEYSSVLFLRGFNSKRKGRLW